MVDPAPLAAPVIGKPVIRVDGHLKVTGAARYASDFPAVNPVYAYLATSAIARGRITAIDDHDCRATPGVLDVLTHLNMKGEIAETKLFSKGGYVGSTIMPLGSDKIWHAGQIVAVVLANSFEAARDGACRLRVSYDAMKPSATFDSPDEQPVAAASVSSDHEDPSVGHAESAFATAAMRVEAVYATPTQHHNPIELFTTTCAWSGGKLTVWEGSQNVYGFRYGLAEQLKIDPADVQIISPFIGGAFGSRGSLSQRTALIAVAARRLKRPVKLVASRDQGFTIATYRAETRQRVRLGADTSGKLTALLHEGWEVSSRADNYMVSGTDASTRLYACPNVDSKVWIVHGDRNTPGFMRSPPETPYLFALESAMDELAVALNMDPIELRRINDTMREPIKGLPFTSRHLMPCFDAGAAAFEWQRRTPQPGSMRDGEWLIGMGCASSMYPTVMGAATVRVILTPEGTVKVQTAAHEIGNGAYTVIAQTAADRLGVPIERISVELGNSALPPAPVAGGSNTTASVCTVTSIACAEILKRVAQAATAAPDSVFAGTDARALAFSNDRLVGPDGRSEALAECVRRVGGVIEQYAENLPHDVPSNGIAMLYKGQQKLVGGSQMKDRNQFAFGAVFVEVRVHARTREIRVPRILGAFAAGKIVNPRTAESQLMGGLIWGVSAALFEATEIDRNTATYYNRDLAEYLIPVNADIAETSVIILPEQDTAVNELGIKGIGELGNVGTNAATANAVYHATGVRVRALPIRIEHLLPASALRT